MYVRAQRKLMHFFLPGPGSQASSCLRKGTPLASRVAQGVSGPSSSSVWNPRVHPHLTFTADLPSVAHCFPLRQLAVFTNRRCQPARCTVRPGCFHAPHHSPRFSAVLFLTLCILRGCPRDRITLKRPSAKFLLSPVSFTSSLGLLVPPAAPFPCIS